MMFPTRPLSPSTSMLSVDRLPTPVPTSLISPPISRHPSAANTDSHIQHSANTSFFFSPPSFRPTPPPSIRSNKSSSERDADDQDLEPPSTQVVSSSTLQLPLHRFFPSRYTNDEQLTPPRQFVDLNTENPKPHPSLFINTVPIEDEDQASSPLHAYEYRLHPNQPSPPLEPEQEQESEYQVPHSYIPHLLEPGAKVGTDEVPLELVRPIGEGSFSCVWLAKDVQSKLCSEREKKKISRSRAEGRMRSGSGAMLGVRLLRSLSGINARRKSESVARRKRDMRDVQGLTPPQGLGSRVPSEGQEQGANVSRQRSVVLRHMDGEGATELEEEALKADEADQELPPSLSPLEKVGFVAVKMMSRALCDVDDRMRISFVREVEVLRHISHPSIVAYLHSFTSPTHHALVLEYVPGGELFDLLNIDANYMRMSEKFVRRVWSELARAVGWMHGVGLVHRDVKLENILLTRNPFTTPSHLSLPPPTIPLVKLTDFNLARFIDVSDPLLSTKCGSEAYAAPEIVLGKQYDGRRTDAWACGVVLYAIVVRRLPFDDPDPQLEDERGFGTDERKDATHPTSTAKSIVQTQDSHQSRRDYLLRIARGDYSYPQTPSRPDLITSSIQKLIGRLLVRDPERRARVVEVWDEEWMDASQEGIVRRPMIGSTGTSPGGGRKTEGGGKLVDREHIGSVARSEVM